MFIWFFDDYDNDKQRTSDWYKKRIKGMMELIICVIILYIPISLYYFFRGGKTWWIGLIFLIPFVILFRIGYKGLKSLKKGYEEALLKEKYNKEKEKQNEIDKNK